MTAGSPRTPTSISETLKIHAEINPAAVAIAAPGREPLTYKGLLGTIVGALGLLNGLGFRRKDRIAIVLPNGPESATAFLAVACGLTAAPLNPDGREDGFRGTLSDLDARALLTVRDFCPPAVAAARSLGIPVVCLLPNLSEAAGRFSLNWDSPERPAEAVFAAGEDVALALHTSGTTSRPKVVPLTHANLCHSACSIGGSLRLGPEDRCLNVMPLFHVHGLVGALLATLATGGSIACAPGFLAPRFFEWMEECCPTWYTAVPTMHQSILQRVPGNEEIIARRRLRFIRSCSSPLPTRVISEIESAFAAPVVEAYGMTEASHQISVNPLPPRMRKPGSVGLPAGTSVGIMGEDGSLLGPHREGEIVVRGTGVTAGYERNPAANAASFVDDWFKTGDRGYQDEDGYLFITSRIKEIINRGGEKISPREIEEALLEHPGILQAVAFAVPDARLGEEVGAALILRAGAKREALEYRRFVACRLPDFKTPRLIVFLDELPKGPTGKPMRIGLAARLGVAGIEPSEVALPEATSGPKTPIEEVLAEIWREVLKIDKICVSSSFADLGGDSILALRIIARIRERFGVDLSVVEFSEHPTAAMLAGAIAKKLEALEPKSLARFRSSCRPFELGNVQAGTLET